MLVTLGVVKNLIAESFSETNLPPDVQVLRDRLREQGISVNAVHDPYWIDDVIASLRSGDQLTRQLARKVWEDMSDGYLMLRSKFMENHRTMTVAIILELLQGILDSIDTTQIREPQEVEPEAFEEDDPDFPDNLPTTLEIIDRTQDFLFLCRQYISSNTDLSELQDAGADLASDFMIIDNYGMFTDEGHLASNVCHYSADICDPNSEWKDVVEGASTFISEQGVSAAQVAALVQSQINDLIGIS